jgi:Protein of unknown function (DUF3006).
MPNWVSIDRIADGIAVLEQDDRTLLRVPLSQLPPGAKEGDCLRTENGVYFSEPEETDRRRAANRALLNRLLAKSAADEGTET